MLNTAFSPWPSYTDEEADAIRSVLLSNKVNYWTGTECRLFEKEFSGYLEAEFAIALANGSVALELALKGLGIGPGDEVIVSSRTYVASASSIVNVGAVPIFADVDRNSQNITASTVADALSEKTAAIICVHLGGWPCDMDPIMSLARENNLYVIEDCAQAHGAEYEGRAVGTIGDIGCWSFCQDKIITTGGEGGMVTTNNPELWSRMWSYKDHGKSWDAVYEKQHPPGYRWVHASFGTNWRMTEIQAAIGRIQLSRMSAWRAARQANIARIWSAARKTALFYAPTLPDNIIHAAYKCYAFIKPEQLAEDWSRERIMLELNRRGIPCNGGSCPEVYLEACFQEAGLAPQQRLETAKKLGETSVMFLVHPTLTEQEIQQTCDAITIVAKLATKRG